MRLRASGGSLTELARWVRTDCIAVHDGYHGVILSRRSDNRGNEKASDAAAMARSVAPYCRRHSECDSRHEG